MEKAIIVAGIVLVGGSLFGSEAEIGGYTVEDYPQTGLYAHWDGILNAQADSEWVHDDGARVWQDLKGRFDLSYSIAGTPNWAGDAYVSDDSVVACMANQSATFWTELGATWTLQAYVVPTAKWWNRNSGICGYHTTTDAAVKGLIFGQYMSGNFQFYCWGNKATQSGYLLAQGELSSFTDKPLLLTMVATPASLRLYANETLVREMATSAATDTALNAPGFLVGSAYDALGSGNTIFNGKIHAVRLYARALTAGEVSRTWHIDQQRFAEGQSVSYVESTGTQWVDTGIVSLDGLVIEVDFTVPADAQTKRCVIFGHKWDADGYLLTFDSGKLRYHCGGKWVDIDPAANTWQTGKRLHFRGNSQGCQLNGGQTISLPAATQANDQQATIKVFRANDSNYGAYKLHHFSIKNAQGEYLCDYYPARRQSDNVVGLYDAVTKQMKFPSGGALNSEVEASSVLAGALVNLVGLDSTAAEFAVVPIQSESSGGLTAVLTHEGKTEKLPLSEETVTEARLLKISGLKSNTQYRLAFETGTAEPGEPAAMSFTTLPAGFADGGYTRLEYVESTGAEKLNLKLRPNASLVTALDFTPHDATGLMQGSALFGAEYSVNGYLLMFAADNSQLTLRFNASGDWKDVDSSAWEVGQRVKSVSTTTGFAVNGRWTPMTGSGTDVDKDIWLLTTPDRDNRANWRAAVRIHGCVISNQLGGVMRDYIPARRNSDNAVGLYDRVNHEFRLPDSGAFIAGKRKLSGFGIIVKAHASKGGGASKSREAVPSVMREVAPGAIRPTGWLREMVDTVVEGYTANMDEVDEDFQRAWGPDFCPRGDKVHWSRKQGSWPSEGGAYWFEALSLLAFQLDDPNLKQFISNRLETVITRINPNSWGFLWWMNRQNSEDVAALTGDPFLLRNSERLTTALVNWYRATGDKRIPEVLKTAYAPAAFDLTKPFVGGYDAWQVTKAEAIANLLDTNVGRLGDDYRVKLYWNAPGTELAQTLWQKFADEQRLKLPTRHGYDMTSSLMIHLRAYQWSGDVRRLEVARQWLDFFAANCHMPYGQIVKDEEWGWPGAYRGVETCTAARENQVYLSYLAALGEGRWGDEVEDAVFNIAVNAMNADCTQHVYFQQPNRLKSNDLTHCSHAGDPDPDGVMVRHGEYRRKHYPLCCTAGLNLFWPNFIQNLWLLPKDGGVAAALYSPCTLETALGGGRVRVKEETNYPFTETIRFTFEQVPGSDFPLWLRMPRWCAQPQATVNGEAVTLSAEQGFARINREWQAGDVVVLTLPMTPRLERMRDMNPTLFDQPAVDYGYFKLGPLLFAQHLPSEGLNADPEVGQLPKLAQDATAQVVRSELPVGWANPAAPAVRLVTQTANGEELELVPYGCAKFRISMFEMEQE